MPRPRKPTPIDQARRLIDAQTMIKDMADATPGLARDLRRGALELIGDIVAELVRYAPSSTSRTDRVSAQPGGSTSSGD